MKLTYCFLSRLKELAGDWHEFESKALRRENERKDKEARRAVKMEEQERDKAEKAKRRASAAVPDADEQRDVKRAKQETANEEGSAQEIQLSA